MRMMSVLVLFLSIEICFGSPTRSSIGAVHSKFSQDEETFDLPYVTEGLVAMWDGIWNSGIEEHSAMPEVIKDLVGDHDLTLVYGGYNRGMAIGEDYFAPNNIYGGKVVNYDIYELKDAILSGQFTIEICVQINVKNGQLFLIDDNTRMYGASQYMSWLKFRGSLTLIDTIYTNPGETTTFCLTSGNGSNRIFRDGIVKYNFNIGSQMVSDGIELGQATAGGWIYHSIRIYNRALTDEEIELNHLIDRERFGF